ncbi:hypothetical protein Tco_0478716 [Tanacetum coccineum]
MTHRSCLRWKPTGKIFKTVGLRWVPTRKIFTSSITKVDSEPTNGSNDDITNQYECKQTLDVSAVQNSEFTTTAMNLSSSKLVLKVVPPADKTATSRQELELLFHHHITMLMSTYIMNGGWCCFIPAEVGFQLPHVMLKNYTSNTIRIEISRILKAQELKKKTSAQTLAIQESSFKDIKSIWVDW